MQCNSTLKDEARGCKLKCRQLSNILEWVQCFGIYIAVLTEKRPECVSDLLGYQALILDARMSISGMAGWGTTIGFTSGQPQILTPFWTLWNIAFAGQARASRSKYCFSLTHQAEKCDWAPPPPKNPQQPGPAQKTGTNRPRSQCATFLTQTVFMQDANTGIPASFVVTIRVWQIRSTGPSAPDGILRELCSMAYEGCPETPRHVHVLLSFLIGWGTLLCAPCPSIPSISAHPRIILGWVNYPPPPLSKYPGIP